MSKKPKRPRDTNQLAKAIADIATGNKKDMKSDSVDNSKNPHAVALGQLGAAKGGKARAKKLSPERRSEIARNAAKTRWKLKKK